MEKIYKLFEKEFNQTSSNRFRSNNDMQYSFTYFYYIMSHYEDITAKHFFNKIDRNKNKILDETEIYYLSILLNDNKIKISNVLELNYLFIKEKNNFYFNKTILNDFDSYVDKINYLLKYQLKKISNKFNFNSFIKSGIFFFYYYYYYENNVYYLLNL
jgi:hypothetical protein